MNSVILTTATRFLTPLLAVFSVYILIRGHNEPGGGFIGGLVVSLAFALDGMSNGIGSMKQLLRVHPRTLIGLGILTAALSGVMALLLAQPYMTGQWFGTIPGIGKVGTVLIFDIGVYLVVFGSVMLVLMTTMKQEVR